MNFRDSNITSIKLSAPLLRAVIFLFTIILIGASCESQPQITSIGTNTNIEASEPIGVPDIVEESLPIEPVESLNETQTNVPEQETEMPSKSVQQPTPPPVVELPPAPVINSPSVQDNAQVEPVPPQKVCCKYCTTGKACGDSCISRSYTCHKGPGCACNAY